jgi:GMP synthase PP-ATPase subunit
MLQGKTDPEVKRKTIGGGFIDVFRDFAITLKSQHGVKPKFLVQVPFHPMSASIIPHP